MEESLSLAVVGIRDWAEGWTRRPRRAIPRACVESPQLLAELLALACHRAINVCDSRDVEATDRVAAAVQELDTQDKRGSGVSLNDSA